MEKPQYIDWIVEKTGIVIKDDIPLKCYKIDYLRLPDNNRVYIEKLQDGNKLFIQPNDILILRSGTVGTSVLCGETFAGHIASDHCLRVRINDKYRGYIAAYLRTKYGFSLLEKDAHGKVIKELVEDNIYELPVLVFENIREQVNELMYESVKKYDEARKEIQKVENELLLVLANYVPKNVEYDNHILSFNDLHINRLDPHMHDSYTNYIFRAMENSDSYYILGDIADVWGTARFKRHYLNEDNENSVGLFSSSDIVRANLSPSKYISKTLNSKQLDKCVISTDTVLVPCSGAYGGVLGHGMLAGQLMNGKAITQHVLRIAAKKDSPAYFYYVAAFLCSDNFGYHLMASTRFGKDIPEIDPNVLKRIPIPRLETSAEKRIGDIFKRSSVLQEKANQLENTAISLIEQKYEKLIV